jgi:glycerophosphoryl diester phosphodiesterase
MIGEIGIRFNLYSMGFNRRDFAVLALAGTLAPRDVRAQSNVPLVIARGAASAEWPEGTRGAYEFAIGEGADFVSASLVASKDGSLIARRDVEISTSTDVASRSEFSDRKGRKTINGRSVEGWFAEDFTLAELKTLNCVPNGSATRRKGPAASILTFQDLVDIARAGSMRTARVIGICARMVEPSHFDRIGLSLEPRIADVIRVNGYNAAAAAMFVESFEVGALKSMGALSRARRVQLIDEEGGPPDLPGQRYADMTTVEGLSAVRGHAEAVGIGSSEALEFMEGAPPGAAALIARAHGAGLAVQARIDEASGILPPPPFRRGDLRGFLVTLYAAGIDGLTSDWTALAVKARREAMDRNRK